MLEYTKINKILKIDPVLGIYPKQIISFIDKLFFHFERIPTKQITTESSEDQIDSMKWTSESFFVYLYPSIIDKYHLLSIIFINLNITPKNINKFIDDSSIDYYTLGELLNEYIGGNIDYSLLLKLCYASYTGMETASTKLTTIFKNIIEFGDKMGIGTICELVISENPLYHQILKPILEQRLRQENNDLIIDN